MKIFRPTDFIMAGAWLLAFVFSVPLIHPLALSRLGAIACMAVFAATGLGRELAGPGVKLPRSFVFWMPPLLWLLAFASMIWSASPMVTFVAFGTLSLMVLGFIVFATGRGIFRMQIPFAPLAFLLLALLGLWVIVQYYFFPSAQGQGRYPFNNPNSCAALLMLGFFPALGWLISASNRKASLMALAVSMILAAAIVTLSGRGVLVLTMAGTLLFLLCCHQRVRLHVKCLGMVLLAAILSAGMQYADIGKIRHIAPVAEHAAQLLQPGNASIGSRLALWKSTWAIIHDHPALGTGYGTFYLFYPQYRLPGDASSAGYMAHNDLLQSWAELGILGPLFLLLFFAGAGWRMMKVMDRRGPETGERAICLSLFMGAAMVALHSLTDFDFYTASILCLLGPVLGLWFRYTGLVLADKITVFHLPAGAPPNAGWFAAIMPLLAIVFALQGFLRSEIHADRAQAAVMAGKMDEFAREVDLARKTSFDLSARPYIEAANVPVGMLEHGEDLTPLARAALLIRAENLLNQADARNTRLVASRYDRAVMARDSHSRGKAAAQDRENERLWLERALALDPGHTQARMMLADLEYQAGHKDKAADILAAGLDIAAPAPDPEAYYQMTASIALEQAQTNIVNKALQKLKDWKAARHDQPLPDTMDEAPLH